jgi:hypothetical protein
MSFRNYDIDKVSLSWLGIDLTEGLSEGTSIQEAKANPRWTLVMGAKGRGTRVANKKRNGSLTLTIDQSSQLHNTLLAIVNADDLSADKVGDCVLRDRSSGEEIIYHNAFFEDAPDESRGESLGQVPWVMLYERKETKPPTKLLNVVGT